LFKWLRDPVPDSVAISVARVGEAVAVTHQAHFDLNGETSILLEPGTYDWLVPEAGAARGITVVEEYSDEFHPRTVAGLAGGNLAGETLLERYARDNWWLFVIVVAALTAEWAWRHQRGLS
jgi:hypothetical protein